MLTNRGLYLTTYTKLIPKTLPHARNYAANTESRPQRDYSASSKLFADAAEEETAEAEVAARTSRLDALTNREANWDGDESVRDAVLRMLVDKYKPLRSGPIRTADEKLKQAPPPVSSANEHVETLNVHQTWSEGPAALADKPLLPSIEGHQPWHTTFIVPSHAQSSIKYGSMPPSQKLPPSTLDEKARRKERERIKRTEQAGRLHQARESTLDYRLGLKKGEVAQLRRPNPQSMKGWASLVEERIEKARLEGRFDQIKGRGQPLKRVQEESNPFIAREEFLMNRIVQRSNAAPPWVEVQGELETTINGFRDVLRQSWTRRAIRMLTLSNPPALLANFTLDDVAAFRDSEWEERERSYHDTALEEVNSLVRKYNGLAPYAVRRPYYLLSQELDRAFRDGCEDVLDALHKRAKALPGQSEATGVSDGESNNTRADAAYSTLRLRDIIRQWISRFLPVR